MIIPAVFVAGILIFACLSGHNVKGFNVSFIGLVLAAGAIAFSIRKPGDLLRELGLNPIRGIKYLLLLAGLMTGVIFAACYMLWMFQRVMFGPIKNEKNKNLPDLNKREIVYLSMILVFIVWIGVYPKTFLERSQVTIDHTITMIDKGYKQTLTQWNPKSAQESILMAFKGQRQ